MANGLKISWKMQRDFVSALLKLKMSSKFTCFLSPNILDIDANLALLLFILYLLPQGILVLSRNTGLIFRKFAAVIIYVEDARVID